MNPFGAELRRLRTARGLSLRGLAKLVHYSRTVLWEWEQGHKIPLSDAVVRLDQALDADGALAVHMPYPNGNTDRLAHVARRPRSVDAAAVDALAGMLATMRRLEDSVGAGPLVEPTAGQLRLVESLADEARGPIRLRVIDLAGQWAQFAGWLCAATGQPAKARDRYARTLEYATESGSRDLIATSLSMRGNLAWMARRPGPVVGLSAAAAENANSPGVRAMALQQEARGHAVMGQVDDVRRLFDEAERAMDAAAKRPEDEPPWIYFYSAGYLEMQRGLAYRLLGDTVSAIEALTAGLAATETGLSRSEFVAIYRLQLTEAHLEAGNRDVALQLLDDVGQIAEGTGSARLAGEVARLAHRLGV